MKKKIKNDDSTHTKYQRNKFGNVRRVRRWMHYGHGWEKEIEGY